MSEFLYLYRLPAGSPHAPDPPQQMQERLKKWTAWFKNLEAKGHMKTIGHLLASAGAVVRDAKGAVHDGPYAESKDIIIEYTVIEVRDLAQVTGVAARCPVLDSGGVVEVRPIRQM